VSHFDTPNARKQSLICVLGEHSPQCIVVRQGKSQLDLASTIGKRRHWDDEISSAINEPHENYIVLNMVLEKLRAIKTTYHAAQIEGNHAQPEDVAGYVDTVRRLKMILDIRIIGKAQRGLGIRFKSSPPLRSLFSIGEKGNTYGAVSPRMIGSCGLAKNSTKRSALYLPTCSR
jgi:hypothetical protein